jgi:hypothetical protein
MNCKADLRFSNIYAGEVNKVLAKLQKTSAVDKMTIRRMFNELNTDYGRMMFDFAETLSLITLVEDFGFGTGENAKRIPRFVKGVQERMDDYADRMGECAPNHAWNKLKDLGIDYHVSATPWTKKGFKSHE